MINIAIVGVGYWGKNLARNLAENADICLHTICDFSIDLAQNIALKSYLRYIS